MTSAPQAIPDLVEHFCRNIAAYHRPDYDETQVRREFIDPLFVALGWSDVEHPASLLLAQCTNQCMIEAKRVFPGSLS